MNATYHLELGHRCYNYPMDIRVLMFGSCRDACGGCGELHLTLPPGSSTADLVKEMASRFPSLTSALEALSIAVNKEYISQETELHDGDEVALIPPLSGG
jgi:molybdopterin converting factor subunit 1